MATFRVQGASPVTAFDTSYIRRKVVKALEVNFVLADLTTPGELPGGMGNKLRWILDANLTGATATNALTNEGGTELLYANRDAVNEDSYIPTSIDAEMETYGTFVPVRTSDVKMMPKGQMDRLASRLSYRGGLLIETLIRATADGSGTGFSPSMGAGTTTTRKSIGNGTNDTVLVATDQLTAEDIALATGDLWATDAEPFSNGMYAAVVHSIPATHLVTDVSTSRLTWESLNKFVGGVSGQDKLLKGSIGGITGTMVFRSNIITTATVDTISAYSNLVLAVDGLGASSMGDMGPDVKINTPDSGSTDNPYRMLATAAFTAQLRPVLLSSARVVKLWSAA